VPNDFNWRLEVPVFNSSYVAQVFVALRWIVVQPLHDLEDSILVEVDDSVSPNNLTREDRTGKTLGNLVCAWIRRPTAMGNATRRGGKLPSLDARPCIDDLEFFGHGADRVWWTELPNGSASSSMTDGGM
jgi:hypothetical protein